MIIRYNYLKNMKITNFISRSISRSIFSYKDPFLLEKQLSDDEKSI